MPRGVRSSDQYTILQPIHAEVFTAASTEQIPGLVPPAQQTTDTLSLRAAIQPTDAQLVRPEFGGKIAIAPRQDDAIPRDHVTTPIAPTPDVTDVVLFQDAATPTKTYYLPRYRVAGNPQYQIALAQTGQEWTLTIDLEKYPAPELSDAARESAEIGHAISVILSYELMIGGARGSRKELVFEELTMSAAGVRAVLRGTNLAERDMLYIAMTDRAYGATLLVRRATRIAIPLPRPARADDPARPILQLDAANRPQLAVDRPEQLDAPLRPILHIGASGVLEPVAPQQERVRIALFREEMRVLDVGVEPNPFAFPRDLYDYMFRNITPGGGEAFTPIFRQAQWNGVFQSYYQDRGDLSRFYYLPDSYKLARRSQPPHYPTATVSLSSDGGPLEAMRARLDYFAVPFVDTERLAAAALELQRYAPAGERVRFEPLVRDSLRYRVALPNASGDSGPFQERSGALVDLRGGIHDSITLPIDEFQQLYAALFSPTTHLLTGQIEVELGTQPKEVVPFGARMYDTAGPFFEYQERFDQSTGSLSVTLRNAIESPIQINRLAAEIVREQTSVAASVQPVDRQFPISLLPNEQATFTVTPASVSESAAPPHAIFDLDGIAVLADPEAVWQAILDPTTPAVYLRTITVETVSAPFERARDEQAGAVVKIGVDFENGNAIILTPTNLKDAGKVTLPIKNYILGQPAEGSYRYQLTVAYTSGQVRKSEWHTERDELLFIDLDVLL